MKPKTFYIILTTTVILISAVSLYLPLRTMYVESRDSEIVNTLEITAYAVKEFAVRNDRLPNSLDEVASKPGEYTSRLKDTDYSKIQYEATDRGNITKTFKLCTTFKSDSQSLSTIDTTTDVLGIQDKTIAQGLHSDVLLDYDAKDYTDNDTNNTPPIGETPPTNVYQKNNSNAIVDYSYGNYSKYVYLDNVYTIHPKGYYCFPDEKIQTFYTDVNKKLIFN